MPADGPRPAATDLSQNIARNLRRGDEPAVEFKDRWFSWSDLGGIAQAVAAALAEIPTDALIGVAPRNRPFHAAAMLGLVAERRSLSIMHASLPPATLARDAAARKLAAIIADAEDWHPE